MCNHHAAIVEESGDFLCMTITVLINNLKQILYSKSWLIQHQGNDITLKHAKLYTEFLGLGHWMQFWKICEVWKKAVGCKLNTNDSWKTRITII